MSRTRYERMWDPRPLSTNRGVTFTDPFGLCERIKNADGTETTAPCVLFAAVMGEARGASRDFQTAVTNVIKNRATLTSGDYEAVINQPNAFSAMNSGDPNRAVVDEVLKNGSVTDQVRDIVEGVYSGTIADNTQGALLYYSPRSMPNFTDTPAWNFAQLQLTTYTSTYEPRLNASYIGGEGLFYACARGSSCWARP